MTWTPVFRSAPVSPGDALSFVPAPQFADQTLRQVLRLPRGGSRMRLRLDNRFGATDLIIGELRVAAAAGSGGIDPATDTGVTAAGQSKFAVPAGQTVVTDPISLALPDGADLAVSLYLPEPTGPATHHQVAPRAGHLCSGNATAAEILSDADELDSLAWIAGVDADLSQRPPVLAAFGDSITNGDGSSPGADNRYVDHLTRALGCPVLNLGISGNRLLRDGFGSSGLNRFERDVLAVDGVTHVLIELGVNDIGFAGLYRLPLPSADELIDGLRALAGRARSAGLSVIVATIIPHSGTVYTGFHSADSERVRHEVNAWIRGADEIDAVLDVDAALRDPDHPARLAGPYDSGDHLHPNDAGHRAVAAALDPDLVRADR